MRVYCSSPTPLQCDNQSAIKIATYLIFYERTKHIEIDCYFTQYHYSKTKNITLSCFSLQLQIVNFFTKTHTSKCHQFLLSKLSKVVLEYDSILQQEEYYEITCLYHNRISCVFVSQQNSSLICVYVLVIVRLITIQFNYLQIQVSVLISFVMFELEQLPRWTPIRNLCSCPCIQYT